MTKNRKPQFGECYRIEISDLDLVDEDTTIIVFIPDPHNDEPVYINEHPATSIKYVYRVEILETLMICLPPN